MAKRALLCISLLALSACASPEDPGALEGTWSAKEPFPVTVTFRSGEAVAMGFTKKVTYQASGDQVLVTYLEGPTKGKTFKYEIVDADTIRSASGTFHRSSGGP